MKKIAILLTLAMLVSSVSVFAAPQINYMFYSEEDGTYYAFGSYNNPEPESGYQSMPGNVGVFLGDNFSEEFDLRTAQYEVSVTTNPGYFGIGFRGYDEYIGENGFRVTPFAKYDKLNTILGDEVVMDAEADDGIAKSNNADLAVLTYAPPTKNGASVPLLVPSFSPDVTEYTLYGHSVASYYVDYCLYKTANSKATVESTLGDDNTRTIKVTAEDGVTTKTYTIAFERDNTFVSNGVNATFSDAHKFKANGTFDASVDKTGYECMYFSNGSGNKYYATYTFVLTETNKTALTNANNIVLGIHIDERTHTEKIKDYTFGVYGVETGVTVDGTTVTHTPGNFTFTETPVGSVTVPRTGLADSIYYAYGIDVTKYVKEAVAAGKPEITLAVTTDGIDFIDAVGNAEIVRRVYGYDADSSKFYNARLLYK